MSRTPGRPRGSARGPGREAILKAADDLLADAGAEALSFRALATRLGVAPMAVAHHVGSRAELIEALAEMVFGELPVSKETASPVDRLRENLTAYCKRALAHPGLVRCLLEQPETLAAPLAHLTETIRADLVRVTGDPRQAKIVLGLAVDYTHGFILSAAATAEPKLTIADYEPALDWILARATGT